MDEGPSSPPSRSSERIDIEVAPPTARADVAVGPQRFLFARSPGSDGMLGRYKIIGRIGRGGVAEVYLAVIEGPDQFAKKCAVKVLLPQFANEVEFCEMFVAEAKVAAGLNHPNVVQTYDFGRVDDRYFLAMEWVDGISLNDLMRRAGASGLGLAETLSIGVQLCEALAYVHEFREGGVPIGIVHRDVTPANILLTSHGIVKLTDFGVAKTQVSPSITATGTLKGKFQYLAPEQVEGERVDARTDLFTLGIVLYELVTGHRLFKRSTLMEVFSAITTGDVRPPSSLNRHIPPRFEALILRLLSPRRDDRPRTARRVLTELLSIAEEQTVALGPAVIRACIKLHAGSVVSDIDAPPPTPQVPVSRRPMARFARWARSVTRDPLDAGLVGLSVILAGALAYLWMTW